MPYVSGFLPSRSAPLFHNGPWPAGLDLRISLAGLPAASIDVTQMGLCGGMSFLARDIHDLADEQRVRPEIEVLTDLTVHPRDGLLL